MKLEILAGVMGSNMRVTRLKKTQERRKLKYTGGAARTCRATRDLPPVPPTP
jgi:hypothetical protein